MSSSAKISAKLQNANRAAHQTVALTYGFDVLPNSAYVRESQLVQSTTRPNSAAPLPFSAPTLWRKVKAGTFPKPVKFSSRVTCWNVGSVRAWIAAQEAFTYNASAITCKQVQRAEPKKN